MHGLDCAMWKIKIVQMNHRGHVKWMAKMVQDEWLRSFKMDGRDGAR